MNIYFTDYFNINKEILDEYGAFDISLINDLPLFIDPFLLFTSDKAEYQLLHDKIIEYIAFLRDKTKGSSNNDNPILFFPSLSNNYSQHHTKPIFIF